MTEYQKQWGRDNRDKTHAYNNKWLSKNAETKLLYGARSSAKRRGIEFSIDVSDIFIPSMCPYLDIPLSVDLSSGRIPNRASIDRIDNSRGYVKGNVQVISFLANKMKADATEEQLLEFAHSIIEIHCKKQQGVLN